MIYCNGHRVLKFRRVVYHLGDNYGWKRKSTSSETSDVLLSLRVE